MSKKVNKDGGRWVTLRGNPIYISDKGLITKGPKALVGLNLRKRGSKSLKNKNRESLLGGTYGAQVAAGVTAIPTQVLITKHNLAGGLDDPSTMRKTVAEATKVAKKHGLDNVQVQAYDKWAKEFNAKLINDANASGGLRSKLKTIFKNAEGMQLSKMEQSAYTHSSRKVVLHSGNEAVYLHEIGHAKDFAKLGKTKVLLRAVSPIGAMVAVFGLATLKDRFDRDPPKTDKERNTSNMINKLWACRGGIVAMGMSPMLYQEGKATYFALTQLAKKHGWRSKAFKLGAKKLGAAGATYAMTVAGIGIGFHYGSRLMMAHREKIHLKKSLKEKPRGDLRKRAIALGLKPSKYKSRRALIAAIAGAVSSKKKAKK